jgi:hypothetical protein
MDAGAQVLAVAHHRVSRHSIVMLAACQLTDAADLVIDGAQARAASLARIIRSWAAPLPRSTTVARPCTIISTWPAMM